MLTTTQIENKFKSLDVKIQSILVSIERISNELNNKTNNSDLNRGLAELNEMIRDTNTSIKTMEEKLSKVLLPEQTRFYLESGEVESFQANFNTLKAMMTKFDKLYKNLVAYTSNLRTLS